MSYRRTLPQVFPYGIAMPIKQVQTCVRKLILRTRLDVPQGSSFAVTVDNWDGTWNLWLSKVSLVYLVTEGLIPQEMAVALR